MKINKYEIRDYNCVGKPFERIRDSKYRDKYGIDIEEICNELLDDEDFDNIKLLNFRGNYISDDGAKYLYKCIENKFINLQILDLSLTFITPSSLYTFIGLLRRKKFKYLVITGTICIDVHSILNVLHKLIDITNNPDTSFKIISKIIFVPKSQLDKADYIKGFLKDKHKKYYKIRNKIDEEK